MTEASRREQPSPIALYLSKRKDLNQLGLHSQADLDLIFPISIRIHVKNDMGSRRLKNSLSIILNQKLSYQHFTFNALIKIRSFNPALIKK